ncbi:MAG: hypothetical protein AAF726_11880 [Planctomycetota bacterium]
MLALAPLALTAAPVALPQQEPDLFVLARLDRVMKVSGYDGPNPTTETVVTYSIPPGSQAVPRGLEIDRSTGDFLILLSPIPGGLAVEEAQILRVDRVTGQTLSIMTLPLFDLDGFEQRYDGELFAIDSGRDLVRIDLAQGTFSSVPLSSPLTQEDLFGMTIDETGMITVNRISGLGPHRYTVDPLDGTMTPMDTSARAMGLESDGNGRLFYGGFLPASGIVIEDLATGTLTPIPGSNATSNVYALQFEEPVDGEGVHPVCDALPNSTGLGATLEVLGTSEIARNDLTLYSRDLPPQSFGYFLVGPNVGFLPVGSGLLCIGVPQARYSLFPLNSGTSGTIRFEVDLFSLPNGGAPVAGRTEVFQYWYRDVGSTSNLSSALAVTLR